MPRRRGEKRDNWLLIKSDDEAARGPRDPDILEEKPKSVVSGRTMEKIAAAGDAVWHSNKSVAENVKQIRKAKKAKFFRRETGARRMRKAKKAKPKSRAHFAAAEVLRKAPPRSARSSKMPNFVPPALATLHDGAPDGANWIHEVKFDGYRMQARLDGGKVKLFTRKALDWTSKFKPVADAVVQLNAESALIDGEIVVEDDKGVSDFSALQDALKHGKKNFVYYVFDLLHLDGADLTAKPLIERKAALERLLKGAPRNGIVRYSEHFEVSGSEMLQHARDHGLEGVDLEAARRALPLRPHRRVDQIEVWSRTRSSSSSATRTHRT